MNQIRIYRDSKEIPVHIYERIESTGDFFYMIKGYDYGDEIKYDEEELKTKFDAIVQDYVLSINSKSIDIENYGAIYSGTIQIEMLKILINTISLIAKSDEMAKSVNYENDYDITELLQAFKIPKKQHYQEQITIIQSRISKIENDIAIAQKKIDEKESQEEKSEQQYDILQDVTFVERVLKISIDVHKTSLYRLGLHRIEAVKEIERLMKQNSTNGRK